jgi:UDP-N-acetylglucosamine 2-epimerase
MRGRDSAGRVLTVVGNRPQFVKAAAVSRHLGELATETLVHSGQHYDRELSAVFFEELDLPPPAHLLSVGSGTHAQQTAAIMTALDPLPAAEQADAVLVYGDTNTTLAAAIVAAKQGIPLVHVEAGMRSFDRSMPEEVNRVAVDHVADLLLCSTETAMRNLEAEGLASRARLVGDVMADIAVQLGPVAERRSRVLELFGLARGEYLVATVALGSAAEILRQAAERHGPLVFPAHPRTRARLVEAGLLGSLEESEWIRVCEPFGYLDFSCLVGGARAVLTDSGGLQKEAYLAGVPCITLREGTEWTETVESGRNRLVGLDPELAAHALEQIAQRASEPPNLAIYGGGDAGKRCAREVAALIGSA